MGMFSYEGSSKMLKKFFGILLHLGHCVLDFNELTDKIFYNIFDDLLTVKGIRG